jgi:hypothetical protein
VRKSIQYFASHSLFRFLLGSLTLLSVDAAWQSVCHSKQSPAGTPLKQTRDPYFNPKLQGKGELKNVKTRLDSNPDVGIDDALPTAPKNESRLLSNPNEDPGSFLSRASWVPPGTGNLSEIPTGDSQPASENSRSASLSSQTLSHSAPSAALNTGSIIRSHSNPNPADIVGDFSADLSQFRRATRVDSPPPANSDSASHRAAVQPPAPTETDRSLIPSHQEPDDSQFLPQIPAMGSGESGSGESKSLTRSSGGDFNSPLSHQDHRDESRNDEASSLNRPLVPKSSDENPPHGSTAATQNSPLNDSIKKPDDGEKDIRVTTQTPPESENLRILTSPNSGLEPTRLLAMVGNEPIFVGDMLFELNQMIEHHMRDAPESVKERERQRGISMLMNKYIDSKLLYVDTLKKLPAGADINKIIDQAAKEFDKSVAPTMMKNSGADSINEFDAVLRMQGASLRRVRLAWCQDQITRYFISQELEVDKEITHRELLEEYQKHIQDYAIPAKARWEQITVRFDRTASRAEAERLLVEMGNKIVYGANFASVAKKGSHGFTATNGGLHDWTAKGELASKELDTAVFSEPIGRLSDKIVTTEGIHIIRVLERTEATHTPFVDAQIGIKERLQENRRTAAFAKHLAKVRQEIPVIRYDQEDAGSREVLRTADAAIR